ncbi:hypothetical protein BCR35DRAFT_331744 [Leucosporidium creatinivorum]|uniref:Uncharacterized protein n=1 Tax=Leucosporidium creatinivorum TaxID=106004 RepID=A0A1Y2FBG3_9BASI|nr:hypothetical protein BCR35DRAFT_331744 [Leucosporidium creatinivorum]
MVRYHDLPPYLDNLPAGTNPFLASDAYWDARVWPTPSPGFKVRLIILGILLGVMLFASLGNIALMAIAARRRGEKLWAVRLVPRENGRVSPVFYFIPLFGSLYTAWTTYLLKGPESDGDGWRLWTWILFFVSGWLLTCGSMQAYALAGGDRRLRLTPRRLNTLFLVVLIVVGGIMLAFCGQGVDVSRTKHKRLVALNSFTDEQIPLWNGTTDAVAFDHMLHLARQYYHVEKAFESSYTRLLAVYLGAILLILSTNLATFAIVVLIRRQIGQSIDLLDMGNADTLASRHLEPPPTTASSADGAQTPMSPRSPSPSPGNTPASPTSPRGPTRSQIKEMAAAESSMVEKEQARRILKLQMAEKGLKISCITISVFLTLIFSICLWTLITFSNLDTASWGTIEASTFLPGWLCSILFGLSQSLRLWRGWKTLPPKESAKETETKTPVETFVLGGTMVELDREGGRGIEIVLALPNLRNIFASFRTPNEEKRWSQKAFYKFCGFLLVTLGMSLIATKSRRGTGTLLR